MQTIKTNDLGEIREILYELGCELDDVKQLAAFLEEELFGKNKPGGSYAGNYRQLQAIFHVMSNLLYKFDSEFSLLQGEGETQFTRYDRERMDELHRIGERWNTPRRGEIASA